MCKMTLIAEGVIGLGVSSRGPGQHFSPQTIKETGHLSPCKVAILHYALTGPRIISEE